jgi:hypothetical protein
LQRLLIRTMLRRMTSRRAILPLALVLLLGLLGGALLARPAGAGDRPTAASHVLVVVGAAVPSQERARVTDLATRAGAHVRAPRTTGEELGVLHLAAARGGATVLAVGLDDRVSVAPVARRYASLRVLSLPADAEGLRTYLLR